MQSLELCCYPMSWGVPTFDENKTPWMIDGSSERTEYIKPEKNYNNYII